MLDAFVDGLVTYRVNLVLTLVVAVAYYAVRKVALPRIERYVVATRLKNEAYQQARIALTLLTGLFALALVMFVWGFDFRGLLAFSTGLIALTGAALFASWSILSNVTCFFLLLLNPSFQRGNVIRVFDADNFIEGTITEINLFNTRLLTEDRQTVIYPNNLLLARPTMINPRTRFAAVGKSQDLLPPGGPTDPGRGPPAT